jgi:hypothetical protein
LIAEAFSIHFGYRPLGHFDSCNDARTGHNRINYVAKLLEEFHDSSRDVTFKNLFGTILYYTRSVVGTFEDRMVGHPSVDQDSLLGCILDASFKDESAREVDLLDEKESYELFMAKLNEGKHKDPTKDFSGYFTTRNEAITRDVFLGTIQHLYVVAIVLNFEITYLHAALWNAEFCEEPIFDKSLE